MHVFSRGIPLVIRVIRSLRSLPVVRRVFPDDGVVRGVVAGEPTQRRRGGVVRGGKTSFFQPPLTERRVASHCGTRGISNAAPRVPPVSRRASRTRPAASTPIRRVPCRVSSPLWKPSSPSSSLSLLRSRLLRLVPHRALRLRRRQPPPRASRRRARRPRGRPGRASRAWARQSRARALAPHRVRRHPTDVRGARDTCARQAHREAGSSRKSKQRRRLAATTDRPLQKATRTSQHSARSKSSRPRKSRPCFEVLASVRKTQKSRLPACDARLTLPRVARVGAPPPLALATRRAAAERSALERSTARAVGHPRGCRNSRFVS